MIELASITRPDEWDFPLFIHVLSSLLLIGTTALALTYLASSWRDGDAEKSRLSYLTLAWAVIPSWVAMRLSGHWIADKQGLVDSDATWIEIGFMAAEPTFLFLLVATIIVRLRARKGTGGPGIGPRIATGLVGLSLIAYLVALWAMTTKPV